MDGEPRPAIPPPPRSGPLPDSEPPPTPPLELTPMEWLEHHLQVLRGRARALRDQDIERTLSDAMLLAKVEAWVPLLALASILGASVLLYATASARAQLLAEAHEAILRALLLPRNRASLGPALAAISREQLVLAMGLERMAHVAARGALEHALEDARHLRGEIGILLAAKQLAEEDTPRSPEVRDTKPSGEVERREVAHG